LHSLILLLQRSRLQRKKEMIGRSVIARGVKAKTAKKMQKEQVMLGSELVVGLEVDVKDCIIIP
jgi:hypothetical protein